MSRGRNKNDDATAEMFPEFAKPTVVWKPTMIPQPGGRWMIDPGKPILVSPMDSISVSEFAKATGLSMREVQRLCDEGVLQAGRKTHRRSSHYAIPRAELLRFLEMRDRERQ